MGVLFSSCDHATIDPESYLANTTSSEIIIKDYFQGREIKKLTIASNQNKFFCICGETSTTDSMIFQKTNGDSIVYHNPRVTNSNFEKTKTRSPYAEEPWDEFDKNQFEYTILPEDFQ